MPFEFWTFGGIALLSGVLTALAPCVLPILPVILGSGLGNSWRGGLRTVVSLIISVVLFTLLLKVLSVSSGIDPRTWTVIAGGILVAVGITSIWPHLWQKIAHILKIESSSQSLLNQAQNKQGWKRDILTGAALGPVFSACSPTYSILIATIFPASWSLGLLYLLLYVIGLGAILILIVFFGRWVIQRFRWASNPHGYFRRILGLILIIVGIVIMTGYDKKLQITLLDAGWYDVTRIESTLIQSSQKNMQSDQDPTSKTMTLSGSNVASPATFSITTPYRAPELVGLTDWISSDPLLLEELKGKVVLIDFWTYSCINCQRTLPTLKKWDEKYRDQGLVIIGVHAPEFAFEKKRENVLKAVNAAKIAYPVALDNDFATWDAYDNLYWPAKYFIDRDGMIRHAHFGEGDDENSESVIQALLSDTSSNASGASVMMQRQANNDATESKIIQNPETYLGAARAEGYSGSPRHTDGQAVFSPSERLERFGWTLEGEWKVTGEYIESTSPESKLTLKNHSKQVYVVADRSDKSDLNAQLTVTYQGNTEAISISDGKMYPLLTGGTISMEGIPLEIQASRGVRLYAFTFGSQ